MYPLNMTLPAGGFAVANDEHEHKALTDHGYVPPFAAPQDADTTADPAPTADPVGAAPVKRGPGRPRKAD